MEEQHRGIALVILGIIAVIAVIGLVLMFSGAKQGTGAVFTNVGVTEGVQACDSPCAIFPSGSDADTQMMEDRLRTRGWVYVGDVILDGTTRTGYISANTPGGWNDPVLGCWCPTEGNPAFPPTEEFAATIPGASTGDSQYAGRYPGTPVDQYQEVAYPAPPRGAEQGVPPGYYPLGTNTMR